MNDLKVNSLTALLDDPDDSVFEAVLEEFLKEDTSIVEHLEHIQDINLDELVQKRLELIIQKIQLNDTKEKIRNWGNQEKLDLFDGVFLISRHRYPGLKREELRDKIGEIRNDIWVEFRNSLTSLEKITIFNHIFFKHYKFRTNKEDLDPPQHYYINRVLETHLGNPVSIAILYTLVAQSLHLPVYYVDFSKNPMLGYFDNNQGKHGHGEDSGPSVLFYIDPLNKGAIIGPKEIGYIKNSEENKDLQKIKTPCPDRMVIKRLVEKLATSYLKTGHSDKAVFLKEIADML